MGNDLVVPSMIRGNIAPSLVSCGWRATGPNGARLLPSIVLAPLAIGLGSKATRPWRIRPSTDGIARDQPSPPRQGVTKASPSRKPPISVNWAGLHLARRGRVAPSASPRLEGKIRSLPAVSTSAGSANVSRNSVLVGREPWGATRGERAGSPRPARLGRPGRPGARRQACGYPPRAQ